MHNSDSHQISIFEILSTCHSFYNFEARIPVVGVVFRRNNNWLHCIGQGLSKRLGS